MALKSRGILDLLPCTACRECPNTIGRCPNCPRFETYRCTNVLDALEELASATPTKLKPRIAINPPAAAKHRKRQGLGDLFDLGNLGDLPSLLDQLGLEGLDLDGLLSLDCTNEETLMGLYDLIEALLDYSALGLLDGSLDGYLDLGTGLYSLNVEQRVALEGYLLCGCKDVWTLITEGK